jgi:hypothetical protein
MGVRKKPAPVTCPFCDVLARKHTNLFQCRRNSRHIADLKTQRWIVLGEKGN